MRTKEEKAARAAYMKEWRRKNLDNGLREKERAYGAKARRERPEQVRLYKAKHRKKTAEEIAFKYIKRKYGIDKDEYDRLFTEQNGVCAICRKPQQLRRKRHRLAVDHHHVTGKIRGLLCHSCNSGIGLLGDDAMTLRSAADYIEKHSS